MSKVRLFGIDLNVAADGLIQQPSISHLRVKHWGENRVLSDSEALFNAWMEIGTSYTVQYSFRLKLNALGGVGAPAAAPQLPHPPTIFRLFDRTFSSAPSGAALAVRSGCVRFERADFPAAALAGDNGTLLLICTGLDILSDSLLPVVVRTGGGAVELDLAAARLRFREGAMIQHTAHAAVVESSPIVGLMPVDLFINEARSLEFTAPLNAVAQSLDIDFLPLTNDDLPLHVELLNRNQLVSRTNMARVALSASNHLIRCTLRSDGGAAILKNIMLRPRDSGGLQLRAYGYGLKSNAPALLISADSLHLALRTLSDQWPSTVMIADVYDGAGGNRFRAEIGNEAAWHGLASRSRFSLANTVELRCTDASPMENIPSSVVAPELVREMTLPYVYAQPGGHEQSFTLAKPGEVYRESAANASVARYTFKGASLRLPLLTPSVLGSLKDKAEAQYEALDQANAASLSDQVKAAQHETFFKERPSTNGKSIKTLNLLTPYLQADPDLPAPTPKLGDHEVIRDYGPVRLRIRLPAGKKIEYVLIDGDSLDISFELDNFMLARGSNLFGIGNKPPTVEGRPLGILKLGAEKSIEEIFTENSYTNRDVFGKDLFKEVMHPSITARAWRGVVFFGVPLTYDPNETASKIIPKDAPRPPELAYLAITPRRDDADPDSFSAAARVIWKNQAAEPQNASNEREEAVFRINDLDIAWYDRGLTSYYLNASLRLRSFMGVSRAPEPPMDLTIIGSMDSNKDIRFLVSLPTPLPLLPAGVDFGPIRQVFLQSAAIKTASGKAAVEFDGALELQRMSLAGGLFETQADSQVKFRGLQISLDLDSGGGGNGCKSATPACNLISIFRRFNWDF